MAVQRQPDEENTGPRWRTVVPVAGTPLPDLDAGEALRRLNRDAINWRGEAIDSLQHWHEAWTKAVNAHIAEQYAAEDRQFLAQWGSRFEAGDAQETDQFQAWLEHAIRAGTVEAQLALVDALQGPGWLKRYAAYVRRYRVSTAERIEGTRPSPLGTPGGDRPIRLVDTETFFYEERS